MSQKFKVQVNDKYCFVIGAKETEEIDLVKTGDSQYHVLKDKMSYLIEQGNCKFRDKSYTISLNGKEHFVKISDELDVLIDKMGYTVNGVEKDNVITAPMPGIIIALNVEKGSVVKEGDTVLILEAMKMENSIKSPKDGIVRSVLIEKGDSVEKNKLLVELE